MMFLVLISRVVFSGFHRPVMSSYVYGGRKVQTMLADFTSTVIFLCGEEKFG